MGKHRLTARLRRMRRPDVWALRNRAGSAPGTLDAPGAGQVDHAVPARVSSMVYQPSGEIREVADVDLNRLQQPVHEGAVLWLHLQGQPGVEQLDALGRLFGLHPLALEDVLHGETRAKVDIFDASQFVVLNRVHRGPGTDYGVDQVAFFLGPGWLISIDHGPTGLFEPVRRRIRGQGKVREHGADYLLYALIDVVIDSGFDLLGALGDRLEALEDEVLDNPNQGARNRIHLIKRELALMRRVWWPQREVIAQLMRDEGRMLSDTTRLYMRDCYDHCVIVIDFVETYREMVSSLLDTYLSAVSQRMNDIMKALTIIATIFLPLTFITGLYGMNFDQASPWNMPELSWRFGYAYALGVMSTVVVVMVLWFRRRGWLS